MLAPEKWAGAYFRGTLRRHSQDEYTFNLNGNIDFIIKNIPDFDKREKSKLRGKKILFGVTSKHPLAHNMAMQAYKQRVNEWLEKLNPEFDRKYGVVKGYIKAGGIIE